MAHSFSFECFDCSQRTIYLFISFFEYSLWIISPFFTFDREYVALLKFYHLYSPGNMLPYVISYLRNRTGDVNIRNVDGMWMASGSAVSGFAGMTVGGIVDKQFGPKIATGIGVFIFR